MIEALHRSGIAAGIHYPLPVHLHRVFRDRGFNPWPLPRTEEAAATVLSLPIYPELSHGDVGKVVDALLARAPARMIGTQR
jgi:dTDP-4-amino-4,6-dideoxygalactose transaminase